MYLLSTLPKVTDAPFLPCHEGVREGLSKLGRGGRGRGERRGEGGRGEERGERRGEERGERRGGGGVKRPLQEAGTRDSALVGPHFRCTGLLAEMLRPSTFVPCDCGKAMAVQVRFCPARLRELDPVAYHSRHVA